MRTNTSLSFLILLLLLFSVKTSFGQYGIRADGVVYVKNREAPIKGAIKFTDHYTKVSILKENEQFTTLHISQIDSVKTEGKYLFVVKEFKENPILLEASVIAPVSLFYSRKLQLFFYSKGKEVTLIPKEKLRGYLLVFFPDFSYTPKLRSASYQKVKYKEEYLAQLVTTYNEEIYPKYYPKVYPLSGQKLKVSVSPYLGIATSAHSLTYSYKTDVLHFDINAQPQFGINAEFEGRSRTSFGVDVFWSKVYGEIPYKLGVPYTSMDEKYQYNNVGKFDISGIGIDTKFKYALSDLNHTKHQLKIFMGPSFFVPMGGKITAYTTIPRYVAPDVIYKPQLYREDGKPNLNVFYGFNIGIDSRWKMTSKYDLHVEAKAKYLQMPQFDTRLIGAAISFQTSTFQLDLAMFLSKR
ncbi:hypothetical protein GOQ04_08535 [Emticicia sp. ODNR4P]|nr:hypothetical protein [Emticicia sp. ODNR4P]